MQQVHMRQTWNRESTGSRCWNEHGSFQTPRVVHCTKPLEFNENVTARCVEQTGRGANIVSNVGGWNVRGAPTEQGWKWPIFITFFEVQNCIVRFFLRISQYSYLTIFAWSSQVENTTRPLICNDDHQLWKANQNLLSFIFPPVHGSSASRCEKQNGTT